MRRHFTFFSQIGSSRPMKLMKRNKTKKKKTPGQRLSPPRISPATDPVFFPLVHIFLSVFISSALGSAVGGARLHPADKISPDSSGKTVPTALSLENSPRPTTGRSIRLKKMTRVLLISFASSNFPTSNFVDV